MATFKVYHRVERKSLVFDCPTCGNMEFAGTYEVKRISLLPSTGHLRFAEDAQGRLYAQNTLHDGQGWRRGDDEKVFFNHPFERWAYSLAGERIR